MQLKTRRRPLRMDLKGEKSTQIKGKKRFEAQREGECKQKKRFNLSNFIFLKQTCITVNYLS
jgi:hypothetical protein